MTSSSQRPPFLAYLAREPIRRILKKDILGRSYILFVPFLIAGLGLYTMGTALGHARRDRFKILLNLLYDRPPKKAELKSLASDLTNLAQKRLDGYCSSYSKEPDSFFDLFFRTELERAGFNFEMPPKSFQKAAKMKLPLKMEPGPTLLAEDFIMEGIAFGASFPELTERIWERSTEIDLDEWHKWRERGLDIAEQPTPMTLEETEQEVLHVVAIYVSEYYAELLKPLGLQLS